MASQNKGDVVLTEDLIKLASWRGNLGIVRGLLEANLVKTNHLNTMASCVRHFSTHVIFYPETWEPARVQNLLIAHGILNTINDERSLGELDNRHKWILSSQLSHYINDDLFEMHLTSFFPGWDQYSPRKKFELVFNEFEVWDANRMRRLIRRQGCISADDIRNWREDGLSLWHWICSCFGTWDDRFIFVRADDEDWKDLLFETIKLVDDLHQEHTAPWLQSRGWGHRQWHTSSGPRTALRLGDSHKVTPFLCILLSMGYHKGYKVFDMHARAFYRSYLSLRDAALICKVLGGANLIFGNANTVPYTRKKFNTSQLATGSGKLIFREVSLVEARQNWWGFTMGRKYGLSIGTILKFMPPRSFGGWLRIHQARLLCLALGLIMSKRTKGE